MDTPERQGPVNVIICRRLDQLDFVVAGSRFLPCHSCDTPVMASPATQCDVLEDDTVAVCLECAKPHARNVPVAVTERAQAELRSVLPGELADGLLSVLGMPASETWLLETPPPARKRPKWRR
jgi:hypothetical protein